MQLEKEDNEETVTQGEGQEMPSDFKEVRKRMNLAFKMSCKWPEAHTKHQQ